MSPEEPAAADPPRSVRSRRVPRRIRRALLLAGWVAATGLLSAEIFLSISRLLG